jgi:hypothetical protein
MEACVLSWLGGGGPRPLGPYSGSAPDSILVLFKPSDADTPIVKLW